MRRARRRPRLCSMRTSRDGEWALLLWLTMVVGWRRGEVCALRWTDVNLDRGLITIERSHWGRREKSTKSGQERVLALDTHTVGLLAAHRAQCETDCAALGVSLAHDAFIFSGSPDHTTPLLPRSVSQRYRRLAQRVGLRSTRLHALRHYSATELIAANVDVRTVAGRLGHGSGGATTLRIYAGWVSDADRTAADTIASIVPRPNPLKRLPRSPYEKVAHELRTAIREGQLRPGDRLPTVLELAATHHVAAGTVNRAIALIKEEGLVDVQRGRRAIVVSGVAETDSTTTSG
jgi:integrase